MRDFIPARLRAAAEKLHAPLYVVGGSVRDFLAGYPLTEETDWDLASPLGEDDVISACETCGIHARNVYRNTGTVKFTDDEGRGYEFARFRSDRYVRGLHTPSGTEFTEDIGLDARRRDFCANAVYYDIARDEYADPLGGIGDIGRRIFRTVREPARVFGEDGLRLLRLARLSAQTGFSPDEACLAGARENAALIEDIVPERIFHEYDAILHADAVHGDAEAGYRGLCILRDTTVLDHTMPELALGKGMEQRKDFHDYDVLEHSFRCVRHALPAVRWAALLHDVGKPFCFLRDGNFHAHADEGMRIARDILTRLKAPRALTEETVYLVGMHMRDLDCKMREQKVRRELVEIGARLPLLFALKQADYTACKEDPSPAPAVVKWKKILEEMKREGVPFSAKELKIGAREVISLGVPPERTGACLDLLVAECTPDGAKNDHDLLAARVRALVESGAF